MPLLSLFTAIFLFEQCVSWQELGTNEACKADAVNTEGDVLLALKMSLHEGKASQREQRELLPMTASVESLKPSNALLPKSGCQYTFLDVGANAGDTVNAFISAERRHTSGTGVKPGFHWPWDPKMPAVADFDYAPFRDMIRGIFKETNTTLQSYCVVGMEANDAWRRHYERFKAHYSKRVSYLGMHSGLAIGLQDGQMDFQCAHVDPEHGAWADGQPDEELSRSDQYKCVVQTRSLPSIIQELHGRSARVLILKVDVESMINIILLPFLRSGAVEALGAEGVRIYVLVDSQHMDEATFKAWEVHKLQSEKALRLGRQSPRVTWSDLTLDTLGGLGRVRRGSARAKST